MTQLSYEPAFDPYHTLFRLHRLLLSIPSKKSYRVERIRILDFYVLFPYLIKDVRLKPEHRSFKKIASSYNECKPYGRHPNVQVLFARMEAIQKAALSTMAIEGLIDLPAYEDQEVDFISSDLEASLYERCIEKNSEQSSLMMIIKALSSDYDLLGPKGLKARTALMEYRNDPI